MRDFITRLKLIGHLRTSLPMDRAEFVKKLSSITDKSDLGMFSDIHDVFSSGKNEFKGQVNLNGFKLKRKRRLFDTNMNIAIANGMINEDNGQLIVEAEINGFRNYFILFYLFMIIIYLVAIGVISISGQFIAIPFILLHATFMFLIPYFLMRSSVKRLKYELEREFFYLTKNAE